MVSLTAVVPVKFPCAYTQKLLLLSKQCKHLNIDLIAVIDTSELSKELTSLLKELSMIGVRFLVGNYGNPGSARNAALSELRGEWVVFWDVDDNPNVEKTVQCINSESDSEVIICNFRIYYLGKGVYKRFELRNPKSDIPSFPGIWRFIFKKNLLDGVYFPNLPIGEDQVFLAKVLSRHPQITFIKEEIYQYNRGTQGQITTSLQRVDKMNSQFQASRIISTLHGCKLRVCLAREITRGMEWRLKVSSFMNLNMCESPHGFTYFGARIFLIRGILNPVTKRASRLFKFAS